MTYLFSRMAKKHFHAFLPIAIYIYIYTRKCIDCTLFYVCRIVLKTEGRNGIKFLWMSAMAHVSCSLYKMQLLYEKSLNKWHGFKALQTLLIKMFFKYKISLFFYNWMPVCTFSRWINWRMKRSLRVKSYSDKIKRVNGSWNWMQFSRDIKQYSLFKM
jgi:hypothetical protein